MEKRTVIDAQICNLLNARDPQGMKLLFQTYYKPLVSYANTFIRDLQLAEDIVQEFFIALWNGEIQQKLIPGTLTSFLRVLVRNRAYNRMTKRDVLSQYVEVDKIDAIFQEYDDSRDQIVNLVLKEVETFPERTREVLTAVFVNGLKYKEVAQHLGVSESTVKTLLGNAIRKLRERLNWEQFTRFLLFFCTKD